MVNHEILKESAESASQMIAAQGWCAPETKNKVMDPVLCCAVAKCFQPYIERLQSLYGQVENLANFIMREVPGEPSQNQGAIDTAIRLLRRTPPPDPVPEDEHSRFEIWMECEGYQKKHLARNKNQLTFLNRKYAKKDVDAKWQAWIASVNERRTLPTGQERNGE